MQKLAIALVATWAIAVGFGVRAIYAHATEPGERRDAPATWPTASMLAAPDGRARIVMFIHSECPCTRSSLAELLEITKRVGARASIEIVASSPGAGWDRAADLPGAHRTLDPLGTEAARFGAATSGHVVVYDAFGVARFSGGITGSRGHTGDNIGRRTVEAIALGVPATDLAHAVFGCGL